jgi:hypothetical protein
MHALLPPQLCSNYTLVHVVHCWSHTQGLLLCFPWSARPHLADPVAAPGPPVCTMAESAAACGIWRRPRGIRVLFDLLLKFPCVLHGIRW